MKYLTNSGLSYFLNKIKAYLTSSTYLNSIGISNSEIDNIADDAGYSSGSLPASEDVFLTGDIIPNTDNSVDLGASSKNIKMIYTKGITINGTQFLPSDYIPKTGSNAISGSLIPSTDGTVNLGGSSYQWNNAYIKSLTINGVACGDILTHNASEFVPRSGGAVLIPSSPNTFLGMTDAYNRLMIGGGDERNHGGNILFRGASVETEPGAIVIIPNMNGIEYLMWIYPNGTWTWTGQAVQLVSDQRFKQQITEIDDKLLDAWEDVDLVQFKYNDAVKEKSDNARLHTGYVVQQIDDACKSHGVDISKYGLYCHEEYPEETEEVEVENEDGTKTKERKVIREASEHYSLRYTEVYAIECAYLRKRIKELEERLEKLEGNSK